jgi:hypothetical protein
VNRNHRSYVSIVPSPELLSGFFPEAQRMPSQRVGQPTIRSFDEKMKGPMLSALVSGVGPSGLAQPGFQSRPGGNSTPGARCHSGDRPLIRSSDNRLAVSPSYGDQPMRQYPDSRVDRGPHCAYSSDTHNPMPWEFTTLIDNREAPVWNPTEPSRPVEPRTGSSFGLHHGSESDRPFTTTRSNTGQPSFSGPSSRTSSTMSRIVSRVGRASPALALVIAVGAAFGPLTVLRRAEDAAFASWRAMGDQLANHELNAISEQLDRDRQDAEFVRGMRDGLWGRLQSLETQRERAVVDLKIRGRRLACDSDHELSSLDAAIAQVQSATARADRLLDQAREDLRNREIELVTLKAEADLNRANLVLARPIGDPALWSARVARARDLLGTPLDDRDERGSTLESPVSCK